MAQEIIKPQLVTEAEYILSETKSEQKNEFLSGKLISMKGASFEHNEISLTIAILLKQLLKGTKWKIAMEAVKTKNSEGNFFYPDLMVCNPNPDKYFSSEPILLIEIISGESRKYDLIDKFIQYQKIETLKHYVCVEPEQQVVLFYNKADDGTWTIETFSKDEDILQLTKLNISFNLKQIYKPE